MSGSDASFRRSRERVDHSARRLSNAPSARRNDAGRATAHRRGSVAWHDDQNEMQRRRDDWANLDVVVSLGFDGSIDEFKESHHFRRRRIQAARAQEISFPCYFGRKNVPGVDFVGDCAEAFDDL